MTQQPYPMAPVPPPPPNGRWQPERVDAVPGTGFGLVQLKVEPITSGLAIGSLMAGVGSIRVSLLVLCFGLSGAGRGWGGVVAGAFALLGALVALIWIPGKRPAGAPAPTSAEGLAEEQGVELVEA